MNTGKKHILIVDDEESVVSYLQDMLGERGFVVTGTTSALDALERIESINFDLVISDVVMPEMRGLDLMQKIHESRPDLLVLLITAFGDVDLAVEALKAGACDFITKPFRIEVLDLAIARAFRERRMRREIVRLRHALREPKQDGTIIADSRAMRRVLELAQRAAPTPATVLITGESGTGKSHIARHIHDHGPRSSKPFVQINCGAIPPALLESELFGAKKGAYTDARQDRKGVFEQADRGTLFLDEIGELPLEAQTKLLQVLETRSIRPLGAEKEIPVDVRMIAATNRDLDSLLQSGDFRTDLYYRLNVVHIEVPPLRERPEDIEGLIDMFLAKACERLGRSCTGVSQEVLRWMMQHDWPGNIRELGNLIERAVALSQHDVIVLDDLALPQSAMSAAKDHSEDFFEQAAMQKLTLEDLQNRYIGAVLQHTDGNKVQTAKILGIDRKTLYRRLNPE